MGLAVLITALIAMGASYRFYITPKINRQIDPSPNRSTPARRYMDGVNFFPSRSRVLTAFQFKSISIDIVIGPVIAVQFGWLPAVIWLLVGVIFFGWVQDYLVTIISIRSAGLSITQMIEKYFNLKSQALMLGILWLYLLIISSQFSLLLAALLSRDELPTGLFVLVITGFLAGYLIYRTKINLLVTTALCILIAILGTWISSLDIIQDTVYEINKRLVSFGQISSSPTAPGISWQSLTWIGLVYFICYLAATLPTWRFAVPFNYLSGWLVILGFGITVIGYILGTIKGTINTTFEIPAYITANQPAIGPLWPVLFVTLSSGAVSGWHSLVSSYTTSHQIEKEPLVKPITVKGIFGESLVVVLVLILSATFGVSAGAFDINRDFVLTSGPATAFAVGIARTWSEFGISAGVSNYFSTFIFTLMSISVLFLVVRYGHIVQSGFFESEDSLFKRPGLSTLIFLVATLLLVVFGLQQWLWVLFAGTNQLLAAIVLILAAVWLKMQSKSFWWVLLPAVFLYLTGMAAILYNAIYMTIYTQLVSNPNLTATQVIGSMITFLVALFFITGSTYIISRGLGALFRSQARLS